MRDRRPSMEGTRQVGQGTFHGGRREGRTGDLPWRDRSGGIGE